VEQRAQGEIDRQRRPALGRFGERVLDAQALARFCGELELALGPVPEDRVGVLRPLGVEMKLEPLVAPDGQGFPEHGCGGASALQAREVIRRGLSKPYW
jgi:hypothetical protein